MMKRSTASRLSATIVAFVACLVALTCTNGPIPPLHTPPTTVARWDTTDTHVPSIEVLVENKGYYDADVWVLLNDGYPRRLGTVSGFTSERFPIRGGVCLGCDIALYAKTIGPGTVYRSDLVAVYPGMGLRWTIGPLPSDAVLYPQYASR